MAASIDLKCVRGGLVTDPKDFRFCEYAEAVTGSAAAQAELIAWRRASRQPASR
jgi:hypothetical protein